MRIKLYEKNNSPQRITEIVDCLERGGVIIYPTDTCYAFGCAAHKERAIERICTLKRIDVKKHYLSIVGHNLSFISDFAKVDNPTFKLMKRNTPGAFTFILPPSSSLSRTFRYRKQVGIRIPDSTIARLLCESLGQPLLSATLPYEDAEPEYLTDPELIEERWGTEVDLVIDGGIGGVVPSTVVDCTVYPVEIVRQGKGELI